MGSADKTLMIYDTLTRFYWLVSSTVRLAKESLLIPDIDWLHLPFMALFCCCSIWSRIWCWHSIIWFPYGHLLVSTLRPIDPHFSVHMSYLSVRHPPPFKALSARINLAHHVKIVAYCQFSKPNFQFVHQSQKLSQNALERVRAKQNFVKRCRSFQASAFINGPFHPEKEITNMNILLWLTLKREIPS